MDRIPHAAANRGGFSLIESVVAIVLLAVGIVALEGALALAVRSAATADRVSRAATLAEYQRERAFARCAGGAGADSLNGVASDWRATLDGRTVHVTQRTRVTTRGAARFDSYDAVGRCP